MKRCRIVFVIIFAIFPLVSFAAEPAWWTQQKQKCGISAGTAYNTWVSQGSACNTGGSSSRGGTSSQEVGKAIGQAIGQAIGDAIRGNPEEDARKASEAQFKAAEAQARADEQAAEKLRAEEQLRIQHEEMKNRLLGGMMNVGESSQLGLIGVDSSPGLTLMTGDKTELIPPWDEYKSWEQHKRDVLAYQEQLTKENPENKENQNWCKGHIPLSMGSNSASWEARCSQGDGGRVKSVDVVIPALPKVETIAIRTTTAPIPALKEPAIALPGTAEEVKSSALGGFDTKNPMLGTSGAVPKIPETFPVDAPPVAAIPKMKELSVTSVSLDEGDKSARQGDINSKGSLSGSLNAVQKAPISSPVAVAPVKVTASAMTATPPVVPIKKVPVLSKPTSSPTVPAPKKESAPIQKAVAEKQVQALGCAISELKVLASGMGEEGASMHAELKGFLNGIRSELNKPCSGQPETQNIQTISLSNLTKGAQKKEEQLEANILVTRNEQSCEVHLHVQHASSFKSTATSSRSGQSFNEGQSIIQMDKNGAIIAAESPIGVEKCLAGMPVKR